MSTHAAGSVSGSGIQSSDMLSSTSRNLQSSASYTMGSSSQNTLSQSQTSSGSKIADVRLKREFYKWSPFRQFIYTLVESNYFGSAILIIIFLNTILITLQMDVSLEQKYGWYFSMTDNVFLGIYVFEMVGKLFAQRLAYFQSGWNLFDGFIVFTSFLEYIKFIIASFSAFDPKILRFLRVFRSVRALRALRVLRTISFLKSLQIIVFTLLKSIPALASIAFLLFLVMYIFAVIGRTLYADVSPIHFSNIYVAMFTLFQLMTLDDWFGIYEAGPKDGSMLVYLLIFIILETFIFINLFIAVIVNNLQALTNSQRSSKLLAGFRRKRKKKELQRVQSAANAEKKETFVDRVPIKFTDKSDVNVRRQQLEMYLYMLVASLENNMDFYQSQQHTLHELVDLLKPKADAQ